MSLCRSGAGRCARGPIPLLALALLVTWPIIRYGAPNHFYRIVELSWHVRHGDLYPRWLADVYSGFGAPVFNFYAPLSYYVPLIFLLTGASLAVAFLLSFVAAVGVGVFGAYCWARDQFVSPTAGVVAAAAYSLSPYYYYNTLIRGSHAEVWALWAALRWRRAPAPASRAALVLLLAALAVTHTPTSLLIVPVLVVYVVAQAASAGHAWRAGWRALAALSIFLAQSATLAAFFILPFWLEAQYVGLQRAALDYRELRLAVETAPTAAKSAFADSACVGRLRCCCRDFNRKGAE